MGLATAGSNFNDPRPFRQLLGQQNFNLVLKQRLIRQHNAARLGLAQHRTNPRMGVLHIKYRVFLGLITHLVQIKIQRRLILAGQHDKPGHVLAHQIDNLAQQHERPGALGHLERGAVFIKPHQLRQLDIKRHAATRQGRHSRLHPPDIPTMVRTQNINQLIKAALNLVMMIGNVGGKIGP